MESIMGGEPAHLAETDQLLSDTQTGARRGRSTESALKFLTEEIHTV